VNSKLMKNQELHSSLQHIKNNSMDAYAQYRNT